MYKKKILNGIFYIDEIYDKNLEFMPNASAGVNVTTYNGFVVYTLRSYTTNILTLYINIKTRAKFLEIGNVHYSRTTMRHVKAFIKEYLPPYISYDFLKEIYDSYSDIMVVNIPDNYKEFDFDMIYTDREFIENILDPILILNRNEE